MPELPEVEVVKRQLESICQDRPQIARFDFRRQDLRDPMPLEEIHGMTGARILAIKRRAKYLLIETENGGLLSHLGMTGTWRLAPPGQELIHDHLYIEFRDGRRLAFRDPRRFGIFETYDLAAPEQSPRLSGLGPEPLGPEFESTFLWQELRRRKAPIKSVIMDQSLVVGVGNIYASESLFLAGIRPTRRSDRLRRGECEVLVEQIKAVLSEAIRKGGSTISDFQGTKGEAGSYQDSHQVYGRSGEACYRCHKRIRQKVLSGRSTFWCPACQV
jgi:formamidopyrimidine-DNA glycosylase